MQGLLLQSRESPSDSARILEGLVTAAARTGSSIVFQVRVHHSFIKLDTQDVRLAWVRTEGRVRGIPQRVFWEASSRDMTQNPTLVMVK